MPRFQRHDGYYTYEPRHIPRRYVVKRADNGKWIAESYKTEGGAPAGLRMKHSDIPQKRDASKLVEYWMENRL